MRAWKSSGLVVILDGESPGDHEQGTVLQHLALASMVTVKYEAPAPEVSRHTGTWYDLLVHHFLPAVVANLIIVSCACCYLTRHVGPWSINTEGTVHFI